MSNRRLLKATIISVVASFLFVHLLWWGLPTPFEMLNNQMIDRLYAFRATGERFPPLYDTTVVHVDITDRTLIDLQTSYITRSYFATVARTLAEVKTSAQAWDFIFLGPTNPTEDEQLVESVRYARNIYLGSAFKLTEGEFCQPDTGGNADYRAYLRSTMWSVQVEGNIQDLYCGSFPLSKFNELAAASAGAGFLNLNPDPDGVVRRIPLLIRFEHGFYPSLALRVVSSYLHVSPENIIVKPGVHIILKNAYRPNQPVHDVVIPIDSHGNMIINYAGEWGTMRHYNFAAIYNVAGDEDEKSLLEEELSGKIVLLAQVTTGSSDVGPVPLDNNFPFSGVQANAINTILQEVFISEVPEYVLVALEVVLMAILVWIAKHLSFLRMTIGVMILLILYHIFAAVSFLYGQLIFNILRPSLMMVTSLVLIAAYRYFNDEKEKEVLRRSFEAYFPPSVVKKIVANPEIVTAPGVKKELTIMFTDIKGFTTHSAKMRPDQIQGAMNEYFDSMIEIVFAYGGTVDKLMGDGLMVFFGDPEPQADHAILCVRAAIDMQLTVLGMRERWIKEGKFPLHIRIGINTGIVVVGNMGSARRLSYTVLGADVNLAQRLEANAPPDGILISEATYQQVKDYVPTRSLGQIRVKGFEQPVKVYEVLVSG